MGTWGRLDRDRVRGAQKGELTFLDRIEACGAARIATDGGSAGHHEFVMGIAPDASRTEGLDIVLTCGPEAMRKKVFKGANASGIRCKPPPRAVHEVRHRDLRRVRPR